MKFPLLFLPLILFGVPSFAQQPEPSANTFHIRKKQPASAEEAGARIFKLYCAESFDTLMAEFFPEEETALEICKEGNLSQDHELYQSMFSDYDKFKSVFTDELITRFQDYKNHAVPLATLKVDSIKVMPFPEHELQKLGTTWQPVSVIIYCSDYEDRFGIFPLFPHRDRWYILGSNLNFLRM